MSIITITADSNERPSGEHDPRAKRAAKLAEAVLDDARFEFGGYEELPVDLQFRLEAKCDEHFCINGRDADYQNCLSCGGSGKVTRLFNVELKEPADYISSGYVRKVDCDGTDG